MKKKYDAIVLGSGIAGLSVAIALAERKQKVLVVSRPKVAGEATPAAAGILDPLLEFDSKSPLLPLSLQAFQYYPSFLKRLRRLSAKDEGYKKTGLLHIALNDHEEKELVRKFAWHRKKNVPMRLLNAEQMKKLVPHISSRAQMGILYPTIGRIQPPKLILAMKVVAKKLGVQFKTTRSEGKLVLEKRKVIGVQYFGEPIFSKVVVNAMGAWASRQIPKGLSIPIIPAKGQILVLKGKHVSKVILHGADSSYLVPWGAHKSLLGSTVEYQGFKSNVTKQGIEAVQKKVERYIPVSRKLKIAQKWAGLRPCAKDHLPLIGETSFEGLYMAAGFFRSGILIGPYVGKLLAEGVLSGKMSKVLKPFDPRRFA